MPKPQTKKTASLKLPEKFGRPQIKQVIDFVEAYGEYRGAVTSAEAVKGTMPPELPPDPRHRQRLLEKYSDKIHRINELIDGFNEEYGLDVRSISLRKFQDFVPEPNDVCFYEATRAMYDSLKVFANRRGSATLYVSCIDIAAIVWIPNMLMDGEFYRQWPNVDLTAC